MLATECRRVVVRDESKRAGSGRTCVAIDAGISSLIPAVVGALAAIADEARLRIAERAGRV